jgi:hypothetical protein
MACYAPRRNRVYSIAPGLVPSPECARCIALQKRYEEALLEEMGTLFSRESPLTSAEELAAQGASTACLEARNALAHHIFLDHPQ